MKAMRATVGCSCSQGTVLGLAGFPAPGPRATLPCARVSGILSPAPGVAVPAEVAFAAPRRPAERPDASAPRSAGQTRRDTNQRQHGTPMRRTLRTALVQTYHPYTQF